MALNIIRCAYCKERWEDCKCEFMKLPKKDEQVKEQMKANGYVLDGADNEERL